MESGITTADGSQGQGMGWLLNVQPTHQGWFSWQHFGHLGAFLSHLINVTKELCFLPLCRRGLPSLSGALSPEADLRPSLRFFL